MKQFCTFLSLALMALPVLLKAQNKSTPKLFTGYQYLMSSGAYQSFKYKREYSSGGNLFTTTYHVYNPITVRHAITIEAIHYKAEQRIEVMVNEAGGGIFSVLNKEEATHTQPELKRYGFRGSVGALGGANAPNQLYWKFASAKFEHIKVAHILGLHQGGEFEFFVLDEK